jgi:hypothetical protein
MLHPRLRHLGIAVALIAALGLAAAQPAEAQGTHRGKARLVQPQPGLFERAWAWLGAAIDMGPGLDPNGARTTGTPPAPVQPTTDAGPGIDPDGRH